MITPPLAAALVTAVLLHAGIAGAQQSFVAVEHDFRDSERLALQLGREFRGAKHHIGVRLSIEYARHDAQGPDMRFVWTDSGFFNRGTTFTSHSRTAGLWLSASYTPIRWYVAPYILMGAGLVDRLYHYETPALDSTTWDGMKWPEMGAISAARSSFGPALRARVGVAFGIRKVRVFGEVSPAFIGGLMRSSSRYDPVEFRDRAVTVGVRF